MRGLGVVSILSAVVINLVLLAQSGSSVLMDSQFKMAMAMMSANPVLYVLSIVLFFGGFALVVMGDDAPVLSGVRRKLRLRKIVKNERKRQEALRQQRDRLNS